MRNKFKKCSNSKCDNVFRQFKTTDKYCSAQCASLFYKPLKKTPLKKKFYQLKQTPLSKKPSEKKKAFETQLNKRRKEIEQDIIKCLGELRCEKCMTDKSIQFSIHHIVFRSEKPNHCELNNKRNLIYLCYKCHESFHKEKTSRNYLIKQRMLEELFGESIWGYNE